MSNVKHLRAKGVLSGDYDREQRMWWYAVAEVKQARTYFDSSRPLKRGELTARAFEAFRDGKSDEEVVLALRITTAMAASLRRERDPGAWWFSSADVKKVRARLDGRGLRARSAAELLAIIDRLCDRDEQLMRFKLNEIG